MNDRRIKSLITGLALTMVLSACVLFPEIEAPPYVISDLSCKVGQVSGYYNYAGIEFDFYNKNNNTIRGFDVSCMVFDATTGTNPFMSSNIVKVAFTGNLSGESAGHFIISLDPYMYTAPLDPYIIDYFYIVKIYYSDGSTWEDNFGTYYTGTSE